MFAGGIYHDCWCHHSCCQKMCGCPAWASQPNRKTENFNWTIKHISIWAIFDCSFELRGSNWNWRSHFCACLWGKCQPCSWSNKATHLSLKLRLIGKENFICLLRMRQVIAGSVTTRQQPLCCFHDQSIPDKQSSSCHCQSTGFILAEQTKLIKSIRVDWHQYRFQLASNHMCVGCPSYRRPIWNIFFPNNC